MDGSIERVEKELTFRLSTACSPNELLGYLVALLYHSGYQSDLVLSSLDDLDSLVSHFKLWGKTPGLAKLARLALFILSRVKKLHYPVIFKMSSVADHALAISENEDDDSSFLSQFIPSEN